MKFDAVEFRKLNTEEEKTQYMISHREELDPPPMRSRKFNEKCRR